MTSSVGCNPQFLVNSSNLVISCQMFFINIRDHQIWRSSPNLVITNVYKKKCIWTPLWCHFHISPNHVVARQQTNKNFALNIHFHKPNWHSLITKHSWHRTCKIWCELRNLLASFAQKHVGGTAAQVFLIVRFKWQNGTFSTSSSPNLMISKMIKYSSPVYKYSCIEIYM